MDTNNAIIREVQARLKKDERIYLPIEYSNSFIVRFEKNQYPLTLRFRLVKEWDDDGVERETLVVADIACDEYFERLLRYFESSEFLNAINQRVGEELVTSIRLARDTICDSKDYQRNNAGTWHSREVREGLLKLNDVSPNAWAIGVTFFFSREIQGDTAVEAFLETYAKVSCCGKEELFDGPWVITRWDFVEPL